MAKKSGKSTTSRTSKKAQASRRTTAKSVTQPQKTVTTITVQRSLKVPQALQDRFHKPIKHPVKLPSVWWLSVTTGRILWQNKVLFLAIAAWYAFLDIIFAQGLSSSANVTTLKSTLDHITASNLGPVGSSLGRFLVLFSSSGNTASPTAGFFQFTFAIITTLAVIWAIRQRINGVKIRIRDAYYRGMYPIIPFILVLLVICTQLIPFIIGSGLYVTVTANGIAAHFIEQAFWLLLLVGLTLWSLYMITATIFALYIVALPDMTPLKAIRSARQLVRHRRFIVLRKILFMPVLLFVIAALVMLPIILVVAGLAPLVLLALTMIGLVAVNAYMYTLYRELLNE